MPEQEQAQYVVVGGGIMGCSVAYHLAKMGARDVLLLEKGDIASGSTARAAGLVTQFHTSPTMMQIRMYSMRLYNQIKEEVGETAGWNPVGSLRVASSREQMMELQRKVSQAKAIGLEVEIITPAEALQIYPLMSPKDLYAGVYLPEDGHLDPYSMTMELARRARQMGVRVRTGVLVTGLEVGPDGAIRRVLTNQGPILAETVVIAAGMWSPRLAAAIGLRLPMNPVKHQYLTTRPIPGSELPRQTPVLRDPDRLVYIREEVGGFLVGGFETDPAAVPLEKVTWEFGADNFPPDWQRFDPLMEGAMKRIPALEQAQVIGMVNYPDALTPDGNPCLGPVPGKRGLYVAAGMSLNGFGGGGGMGKLMAEWILEGEPSIDVHEYNVRRFGPIHADPDFLFIRAREAYKYYYFLHYPHDEWEWGRPRRTSPLYQRTQELGAVFGEKVGWERVNYYRPGQAWRMAGADQREWGWGKPPFFERVAQEHRAVREHVAIADLSSFGKIDVQGPHALDLLQHLTDNDLDRPVGSVVYTQFLNARGGIESDLTITRLAEDHFRLTSGSAFVYSDLGWLEMQRGSGQQVEVRDLSEQWACIGLWGPLARQVLEQVTSADVSNQAFPYMTAQWLPVGDSKVLALRVSYVGELGWELYVEPQHAVALWDALMEAGRPLGIEPIGYKAIDGLRLEKGYRYWSVDMTPAENPYEAGLGFCVHLNQGDFLGRQALLQARQGGIARRLRTLIVEVEPWHLYGGEAVYFQDRVVSRLRSTGYGHSVGKTIALTYLPQELGEVGTELQVEAFGRRVPARVAQDCLYDPKGSNLRA